MDRRRMLLGEIALGSAVGIEIGALAAPLVRKSESQILYVDYTDTETLRRTLRHPGVSPADVVEVDIIWGRESLATLLPGAIDYALASHVIEHVPDVIGWLFEVHACLRPGGCLGLVIPDKRYTFDFFRQESDIGGMLEAYLEQRKQPGKRQLFEAMALSKDKPADTDWRPEARGAALPGEMLARLPSALAWWREALGRDPGYIDAHCWVFTPASFLDAAEALSVLGCFPFRIALFAPTRPGAIEFVVRLEAVAPSEGETVRHSITAARRLLA